MHVLILGPTGTAGHAVLQAALADVRIDRVSTLHRRRTELQHPKLNELVHTDFTEYTGLDPLFASIDICFFCLGISQLKEKDRVKFFKITHDYPVSLAKSLHTSNPDVTFCFLSGQGADPTGKSSIAFAKAKGAAENSLSALGLKRLFIFRPGYIHPDNPHPGRLFGERVYGFLFPLLKNIIPSLVIRAEELARGMINVGLNGHTETVLNNKMINAVS
jgi:uncharacterized protein YbjT (DUF2867 family)